MKEATEPTLHETLADWFAHLEAETPCPGGYVRHFGLEDGRVLKVTLKAECLPCRSVLWEASDPPA